MHVLGHAQMRRTTDTCRHTMPILGRDAAAGRAARSGSGRHWRSQWPPRWHQERPRPPSAKEDGPVMRVELRGLEPLTPTLPGRHDRVRGRPPASMTALWPAGSRPFETAVDGGEQPRIHRNCNQNCNHRWPAEVAGGWTTRARVRSSVGDQAVWARSRVISAREVDHLGVVFPAGLARSAARSRAARSTRFSRRRGRGWEPLPRSGRRRLRLPPNPTAPQPERGNAGRPGRRAPASSPRQRPRKAPFYAATPRTPPSPLNRRLCGAPQSSRAPGSVDSLPVRPRPRWKDQHRARAVPGGVPS